MVPTIPPLLHVGCGSERIPGWINLDLRLTKGATDLVADLARGLPVKEAGAVFCEHVLEHLPLDGAISFLESCRDVLRSDGWLRISTPNLDWVWQSHYSRTRNHDDKALSAVNLNRAFRGWGHRFLWNGELLEIALEACGFRQIRSCRYGESSLPFFQSIERHERYEDLEDLHHVLVYEAQRGAPRPERLSWFREMAELHYLRHLE